MYILFGIPNCDTVKKARTFLASQGISYEFVDFKKSPPTKAQIQLWEKAFSGLPVNRQGVTFKKFKNEFESLPPNKQIDLMIAQPSMIKRPILQKDQQVIAFGFDLSDYQKKLGTSCNS